METISMKLGSLIREFSFKIEGRGGFFIKAGQKLFD
jgi:hypothetical protein